MVEQFVTSSNITKLLYTVVQVIVIIRCNNTNNCNLMPKAVHIFEILLIKCPLQNLNSSVHDLYKC